MNNIMLEFTRNDKRFNESQLMNDFYNHIENNWYRLVQYGKKDNKIRIYSNYIDIKKGDIIIHNRFGRGEVVQTDGLGSDKKAEVEFETSGIKKILLKFAKYEIIK